MESQPIRVSYDVKDLFERIDTRLIGIDTKLDTKADARVVDALEKKVEELTKRLDEQDTREEERTRAAATTFTRREKFIGFIMAAAAIIVQPILQHFHL